MNKTASLEWLTIAYHDLKSAQILYDANHYTDSIGSDLQQSIEKILKSMFAYNNEKIPKTHDLYEIYDLLDELIFDDSDIDKLHIATEYLKEDRYPNPNYCLPPRQEIKAVIEFTQELLKKVCTILNIDKSQLS
ncbi:MAG: HEPN domain-containing protein [Campylobacterota bacterium]|nr:HEPN domain-containing protein [Campylobacterota bacterium]